MSCYAEVHYINDAEEHKEVLVRFDNKEERDYVAWRFVSTALPSEGIRAITVAEARKRYDLSRFDKLPYSEVFFMANPDRPGTNWRFDAIEPSEVYSERQRRWQQGRGNGVQMTLLMEGE